MGSTKTNKKVGSTKSNHPTHTIESSTSTSQAQGVACGAWGCMRAVARGCMRRGWENELNIII